MSKYKKQHFVPKCYLKAWCDPNMPPKHTPYIWIFEKESKKVKKKAPDNIFHETDLYTIWDETGKRDLTIEHGFSGLEKLFTDIRRKKLSYKKQLIHDEHFIICIFIASMHARTKSKLNHLSEMWKPALNMMDDMIKHMETATEQQKEDISRMSKFPSLDKKSEKLSYEDVQTLVNKPMESMMLSLIKTEAPLLEKLDFAILCTNSEQGFISSDDPCTWTDPEAYKRPPIYQSPALMYDSIEIIMPISPKQCVFLNRKKLNGYVDVNDNTVNNINRITRFNSSEFFISNQNVINELWFSTLKEPKDSWNNQHYKANKS